MIAFHPHQRNVRLKPCRHSPRGVLRANGKVEKTLHVERQNAGCTQAMPPCRLLVSDAPRSLFVPVHKKRRIRPDLSHFAFDQRYKRPTASATISEFSSSSILMIFISRPDYPVRGHHLESDREGSLTAVDCVSDSGFPGGVVRFRPGAFSDVNHRTPSERRIQPRDRSGRRNLAVCRASRFLLLAGPLLAPPIAGFRVLADAGQRAKVAP